MPELYKLHEHPREIDLTGAYVELDQDGGLLAMKLPRALVTDLIDRGVLLPRERGGEASDD